MNAAELRDGPAPQTDRAYQSFSSRAAPREVRYGIHQVLAAATPGDAITNAALEFRDVLRLVAPSEVFARHIAPGLADDVLALSEFGTSRSRGVIVYHASIGEPTVSAFLLSRSEPVILVYHNITPAAYFEALDESFAELLALGRSELGELRQRVALVIADSRYNASELEALGYEDVRVIPPVVDPLRLVRVEPDASTLHHLDTFHTPILLFVGQLLPHKRPDLLVAAMHVATTYLGVKATLLLVGHNRFERYFHVVRAQIRELNLANVHIVGSVDDARLAAMFRRARAFVTVSEHEGFCVPALEAMAFSVPVVARGTAALPETIGEGGLVLPAHAGPELVAEALQAVLDDDDVHADLVARGQRRLAEITAVDARRLLLEAVGEVV